MLKYEITKDTLALIPINKKKTLVYDNHDYVIVDENVHKIMESNCRYYGSSIEGRLKGTYSLIGVKYKAPIILSENTELVFFPTSSSRNKECAWINSKEIETISKNYSSSNAGIVKFLNCEKVKLDISYNILKNQYMNSISLTKALKNRKSTEE